MSKKNLNDSESNRGSDGRFQKGKRASPETEFKPGEHWREHQVFREKEYLVEEYLNKGRSCADIAKEHSVTESAILHWLRKHGIKRRTVSDVRKLKKWRLSGEDNPMYGRYGDKNPRWIDGSSPERQKAYARSFWKEIAKVVLERDRYECKRCGAKHTGKNKLHAHHIKPWAGNPDGRFELSNFITLCQECHNWVHSKVIN